ncbi:helix-turn-helix domain-containing protein [Bradyrhizobium sp. URHA0013]|uniref:helix-turn-helix domain-containing protein n=1 Tax=Bradyrhizobium sp. URHA0013 TaxID=1380352 RepID=UPI000688CA87|nr:helix-turn-helix domain-containing protein [Bradyrhizobium sp. URHA0013]
MTSQLVEAFVSALRDLAPDAKIAVDEAESEGGESFIDISDGDFRTEVSYRPSFGFGIYVTPGVYGQRPDEVFRNADKAAKRIGQLRESFSRDGVLKHLTLVEMRVLSGLTQVDVANALDIKQPSVQRIERRGNVQIETLARHIHAMGGRLEMSVVFDDMEARLELSALKASV